MYVGFKDSSGWNTTRFWDVVGNVPSLCSKVFEVVLSFVGKYRSKDEQRDFRELVTKFQTCSCDIQKFRKQEYWGLQVLAKVRRGWLVAESIRNIMSMLVAVLRPCRTFENKSPDHVLLKNKVLLLIFPGMSIGILSSSSSRDAGRCVSKSLF